MGGCGLVTSWAGYVGDTAGGDAGDGQANSEGQEDGRGQGDSLAPEGSTSDSGTGDTETGEATQTDGQVGDATASDGATADAPDVGAPVSDSPNEDGADADAGDGRSIDAPAVDASASDSSSEDDATSDADAGDSRNADVSGDGGATEASVPIAFVQVAAATSSVSVSSARVTFAQAQGAGDLVVLVIGWAGSASITQVSDSAGNGYTLAVGPTHISAGLSQFIYYAKGIVAATAGANAVTVTLSASVTALDVRAAEYAGLDPLTPLDTSSGFGGRSTSANSGTVTTSAARELVFGAGITAGSFTGAGSVFTLRKLTGSGLGVVEDRIVSSGSYSADAPLASSAYYVMQVAAFR